MQLSGKGSHTLQKVFEVTSLSADTTDYGVVYATVRSPHPRRSAGIHIPGYTLMHYAIIHNCRMATC